MIRTINVTNPPRRKIVIGHYGENQFRQVIFDVTDWKEQFPNGTPMIVFKRGDGDTYPIVPSVNSDGNPVFIPTSTETSVVGDCYFQLRWTIGDVVGKSCDFVGYVESALGDYGETPEYHSDWIDQIVERTSEIVDAATQAKNDAQAAAQTATAAANRAEQSSAATSQALGNLSNLTTDAKSDIIAAINEVDAHADAADAKVGDLSSLTTDTKGTVVAAVNEVDAHADEANSKIGTLSSLTTTEKSTLVGAINEANTAAAQAADAASDASDKIGDLASLNTANKGSVVAAINEAVSTASSGGTKVGDLTALTTDAKSTLVAAINEVEAEAVAQDGKIGSLSNLRTNTKTNLVAAVNEVLMTLNDQFDLDLEADVSESKIYITQAGERVGEGASIAITGGGLAFDSGECVKIDANGQPSEDYYLHLTLNGADIEGFTPFVVSGGGGGGGTYSVRLVSGMTNASGAVTVTPTVAYNDHVSLYATFRETFAGDLTSTSGTLVASAMQQGESTYRQFYTASVVPGRQFAVDITQVVAAGRTTNIRLSVTGGESQQVATMVMTVNCVDATIAIESDMTVTQTGNFDILYSVTARGLSKIAYLKIDNNLVAYQDIGTASGRRSFNVNTTNMSYGDHSVELWFETPEATSNVVTSSFVFDNGTSTAPVIAASLESATITYGDTIAADYVVYTPGQETTDELIITVYAIDGGNTVTYLRSVQADIVNNSYRRFTCNSYPESGECFVRFQSGETVKVLTVTINELQSEYDMDMIRDGLIYSYSAANKTNDDTDKEIYEYEYQSPNGQTTQIKAVSSGFNWVSDGYVVDETSTERALILSGDAKHVIRLPVFATSYTDDNNHTISLGGSPQGIGRTVEIEYKVSNVTDPTAQIVKCMSNDHSGFVITPQNTWLTSATGDSVTLDSTGFITNEDAIAAAYLRDDTRVVLTFVIEPARYTSYKDDQGITQYLQRVNIYINGEAANSLDYTEGYQFNSNEFISIGSDTCITRLYAVRCYNRPLSDDEVLQNYKASRDTVPLKMREFEWNDVLTNDGMSVDYNKARNKYACLLIRGDSAKYTSVLSPMKTTSIPSGVRLTLPDGDGGFTTEFDCMDVDANGGYVSYNKVQGTTSVKFPIKNYKVYPRAYKNGETKKVKYSLKGQDASGNDLSIPESTFCWKGDYMSSDHANTFNANLADTLFRDTNETNDPSQGGDARVQNTVYGIRCLMFTQDTASGDIEFYADGCLNNDKGNTKTFGLEDDNDSGNVTRRQKWEFKDNSNPLCTFETDKLQEIPTGSTSTQAMAGLESCYPDQGDLEEEGLLPNYDYIQTLFTWVYQRANYWDASSVTVARPYSYNGATYNNEKAYRKAIFINEFTRHFNMNHATVYYLFCEFTGMSDNRAKNMFLSTKNTTAEHLVDVNGRSISINDAISVDGTVNADLIDWENSTFCEWYCDLYDLDSCFGVENSGYLTIPYYADWSYRLNGRYQFNGYQSRLWLMFEECMSDQIASKARELSALTTNGLNYETFYQYHIAGNAMLIPPAIVNRDMGAKYYEPRLNGFIDYSKSPPEISREKYMYLYRGSRTMQKDAYIYKRCMMLYSKYLCTKFTMERITFRNGTDTGITAPNTSMTLQVNQAMFPAVKFGDSGVETQGPKIFPGESCTITMPGTDSTRHGTSDTVYICGGRAITSIGDISKWRPYELQLRNAINFKDLTIGSETPGYTGAMTGTLAPTECVLLESVNVCGVPLTSLNLRTNYLIKEVRADNGCAANVTLPNGGFVHTLHLGACNTIEILNHPNMEDFSIESTNNVISIRVENTPNVPALSIIQERLPNLTGGIRLIGINETLADDTALKMLLSSDAYGKRIDQNGNLVEDDSLLPIITGEVTVPSIGTATIRLLNENYPDLIVHYQTTVSEYSVTFKNWNGDVLDVQYVQSGGNAVDPVASGKVPTPTKPATEEYTFTYDTNSPWDIGFTNVTSSIVTTARFVATKRTYRVRWFNGSISLRTVENVPYGSEVVYTGATPIDESGEASGTYRLFNGWDKSTGYIHGDTDVYAQFTETTASAAKEKTFEQMTYADLYALIKDGTLDPGGANNTYINCTNTKNIVMGKDFNFSNVQTIEPVPIGQPQQFDGTRAVSTGVQLWNEDKSWTVVIDFKFEDTTSGQSIASCFDGNGWRITYGTSSPVFRFGGSTDVAAGPTSVISNVSYPRRDLIVIRRVKGDNNLYVYRCGKMNNEVTYRQINNTTTIRNDAPLSLGGTMSSGGVVSDYGTGTIYWCKVWMDDLGDAVCKQLACWTRETIQFEASGKVSTVNGNTRSVYNNFTSVDSNNPVHLTLLMKNLLDQTHVMHSGNTNVGGWPDSEMRTWCASRVANALPQQLELLKKTVYVTSSAGNKTTTEFATSEDSIFIPSYTEVGFGSGAPYGSESNGTFSQFSGNQSRIKYYDNGSGDAAIWWLRSPYANFANIYWGVTATGSNNGNFSSVANNSYGVCFGFNI